LSRAQERSHPLKKQERFLPKNQTMRPPTWNPPIELSEQEQKVAQRIRSAKMFLFLRKIRHQLFDEEFPSELAGLFKDSTVGKCPLVPAQLALAIILQAYTGVSDDEAIEAMQMDRRWQLVLDCLEAEQATFGKGTLVRFRAALIAKGGDRRLIEKTIEIAKNTPGYSERSLRAALDSSPLWGAARVEDTYNLLGHALRKSLEIIAKNTQQDARSDLRTSRSIHRRSEQSQTSIRFRLG
jgi:hypothetical protein